MANEAPAWDDIPSFDDLPDAANKGPQPQQAAAQSQPPAWDDIPDWDQLSDHPQGQATSQPAAEGVLKTAAREAAHGALPAAGGVLAGVGTGALAGSVFGGVGAIPGAIVGGLAGAYGVGKAQEAVLNAAGYDDSQQRAANAEANPTAAWVGGAVPALAALRPDAAATTLTRAVSGGLQGGIEAGQELYSEGTIHPGRVAAQVVAGAALPSFNRFGEKLATPAATLGERVGDIVTRKVAGRPSAEPNPAAEPAQSEVAQANDQPVVVGDTALEQAPPTVSGDTTGNPQSAPTRSDRIYGKDTRRNADQPDMLTQGDMSPDIAAALQASLNENSVRDNAPLPPIEREGGSPTDPQSQNYTGTPPLETGLAEASAQRAAQKPRPAPEQPAPVSDITATPPPEAATEATGNRQGKAEPPPWEELSTNPNAAKPKLSLRGKEEVTPESVRPIETGLEEAAAAPRETEGHPVQKIAESAAEDTNTSPSAAQVGANNYAKGGGRLFGREVKIENPKGSIRSSKPGVEPKWEVEMPADYGDFKGTKGADGDNIDVMIPGTGDKHFVIDQRNTDTGAFDEHKVIAYAKDTADAVDHYTRGFSDNRGLDRLGSIKEVSADKLKNWLATPGKKSKPFNPDFDTTVPGPTAGEKPLPKVVTTAVSKMKANGIADAAIEHFMNMEPSARLGAASKYVNGTDVVPARPDRIRSAAPKVEGLSVSAKDKASAEGKSGNIKTLNDAFEKAAPPEGAESKDATISRARDFVEQARGANFTMKGASKPYRPAAENHAPSLLEREAKKLLRAKNPSDKAVANFIAQEKLLRSGDKEAIADARATNRIEADIQLSRRSGDEAIANAERFIEPEEHEAEPDEGPRPGETVTPINTKEDLDRVESATRTVDLTTPEGRATLQAETAKLADNLVKVANRKPATGVSEGAASPVRKIDVKSFDQKALLDSLAKAQKKGGDDAAKITEEELGKFSPEPPKKRDLYEMFRDDNGAINHQKIAQDFRSGAKSLLDNFTKGFGYRQNDRMTRTDAVLGHIMSDSSSRLAEKANLLDAHYDAFRQAPKAEQFAFMRAIEAVHPSKTQEFKTKLTDLGVPAKNRDWMADEGVAFRNIMDDLFRQDKAHGSDAVYRENYLSHIFKDAKGADDYIEQKIKSLGPTWYQKQRTFDLVEQAVKAGFELKHDNPIDILNARWAASTYSNAIVDAARSLQKEGLAFPLKDAPDGVKRTWDFKRRLPDGQQWTFAPDAVDLWKNAMEPAGLNENKGPIGSIYRTWLQIKRVVVPMQLMLGAFHEVHIIANILPSQALSHAFEQSRRDSAWLKNYGTAFKDMKDGLLYALPLDHLPYVGDWLDRNGKFSGYAGTRVQDIWRTPDSELAPRDLMVKQLFREAGTSPYQSREDIIGAKRDFADAVANFKMEGGVGNAAKIVGPAIRRGMEKLQEPMFKYQIPRLKNAMLLRGMTDAVRANPELATNPTQRRVVFTELAKNVDDRFGEMFYGRLFWDKSIKDAGIGSMLSMSWNLGQLRQVAGAANQSRQAMTRLITGDERTSIEKARQIGAAKTTFVAHYVGLSMLTAGALSYALSGEPPTGMDYLFPRNGNKNPDGTPQRLTTPFNTREAMMIKAHSDERNSWIGGVAQTIWNKTVLQPVAELAANRDFIGRRLYDTNAPWYKAALQGIDSTLGRVVDPAAISGAQRAKDQGAGLKGQALAIAGFGPAPQYVSETPLERRVGFQAGEDTMASHRPYQYGEKTGLGRGLVQDRIRNAYGDKLQSELRTEGRQKGDVNELVQSGMKPRTAGRIVGNPAGKYPAEFARLPVEDQMADIKRMSAEEFTRFVLQNQGNGMDAKRKAILIKQRSLNQ